MRCAILQFQKGPDGDRKHGILSAHRRSTKELFTLQPARHKIFADHSKDWLIIAEAFVKIRWTSAPSEGASLRGKDLPRGCPFLRIPQ